MFPDYLRQNLIPRLFPNFPDFQVLWQPCIYMIGFTCDTAQIVLSSVVKPVHIFTAGNRVSKSCLMGELFHSLCAFWLCSNIYIYIFTEHWTKRWNWSSCMKLALNVSWTHSLIAQAVNVSWTHGLIAQAVRASERNPVAVGSNHTQANFLQLLLRILQWWIPYISVHSAANMWLPVRDFT